MPLDEKYLVVLNVLCNFAQKMKHVLYLLLFFILCGCVHEVPYEADDAAVNCKKTRYHIGVVDTDKCYPFEFILSNHSDSVVPIEDVEVSCSCLKLTYTPKYIMANSSARITGVMDTRNQHGFIDKSIFVSYNNEGLIILRVSADVN